MQNHLGDNAQLEVFHVHSFMRSMSGQFCKERLDDVQASAALFGTFVTRELSLVTDHSDANMFTTLAV